MEVHCYSWTDGWDERNKVGWFQHCLELKTTSYVQAIGWHQCNSWKCSARLHLVLLPIHHHLIIFTSPPCWRTFFFELNVALPASAACERLFRAAGRVFMPNCTTTTDKHFEQQLLLHINANLYNWQCFIVSLLTVDCNCAHYMTLTEPDVY